MKSTANNVKDIFYVNTGETPPNGRERFISYNIKDENNRPDTTVFFLHGAGGNKNQWRLQWQHLAERPCRLIAWDYPGHGASPHPRSDAAYDGGALLADTIAIFDLFRGRNNLLVAHSYGCRLALALLLALADQERLAQVSQAVLLGAPSLDSPLRLAPAWMPTCFLEWMRPKLTRRFRELAWHADTDVDLVEAEERTAAANSLTMMRALMNRALALKPAALARLNLPVEILAGAADRLTPPACGEAVAAYLPDARMHLVPGAAHQIMLERPDLTNAVLDRALSNIKQ